MLSKDRIYVQDQLHQLPLRRHFWRLGRAKRSWSNGQGRLSTRWRVVHAGGKHISHETCQIYGHLCKYFFNKLENELKIIFLPGEDPK